jgi:hypothetical protein
MLSRVRGIASQNTALEGWLLAQADIRFLPIDVYFRGKADIGQTPANVCFLTQGGHRFGVGHFSLHHSMTDDRSYGTSAVPEGYLVVT